MKIRTTILLGLVAVAMATPAAAQRNRNKNKNDRQPPAPLVAPNSEPGVNHHESILTWTASTSAVDGYNIYRSQTSGGPYTKINGRLCESLVFSDPTVQAGQTYFYVVTAQAAGIESTYSNEASVTIPNP